MRAAGARVGAVGCAVVASLLVGVGSTAAGPVGDPPPSAATPRGDEEGAGPLMLEGDGTPVHRDGAVLVRWSAGADRTAAARAADGLLGAAVTGGWQVVRGDATVLLERLPDSPGVLAVEPDVRRQASGEDVYLDKAQAGAMATIRWPQAWAAATRPDQQTVVAVLDTGVDAGHPDLAGRVAPGLDATGTTGSAADDNGHGTMVAGLAGATTGNDEGIAGIASGVRILPVKVLDAEGYGWDSDIAEGVDWAVAQGADVVNLSLAGFGTTTVLRDAIADARAAGVVVVAATGNYAGGVLTYPAAYDGVIGVGATDDSGDTTNYSQWNDTTDLVAPGHRLLSTYGDGRLQGYAYASGTSFATAVVSGAAALLRSTHPTWGPDQVADRLTTTAVDSGRRGWDEQNGWGVLDLGAALGAAPRPAGSPPAAGALEPDDVPVRAHWVEPGVAGVAGLSPDGDVDWWKVQVDEPSDISTHVELDAGDFPDGLGGDPVVEIFDDQLRPVRSATPGNGFAWRAGTYYLKVSLRSSSRQIGYRFQVQVSPDRDWGTRDRLWYGAFGTALDSIAVGDVTGDGLDDLVVGIRSSRPERPTASIGVAPQLPDGRLGEGWDGSPGPWVQALGKPVGLDYYDTGVEDLELGDVDGDGDQDAAAATGSKVHLLRNDGTGHFSEQVLDAPSTSVELADLEGDGDDDLVTVEDGATWVRRAGGSGYGAPVLIDPQWMEHVTTHDVDADGDLDVVGARSAGLDDSIHVVRQQSGGAWSVTVTPTDQGQIAGLGVAGFVGDQRPEVVTSPAGLNGDVEVRTVEPGGSLGAPSVLDTTPTGVSQSPNPGNVVVDDWNGDGRPDLFAEHSGYGQVDVVPTTATGWGTPVLGDLLNYMQPRESQLRVGDLDGDGRADLVESQGGWPVAVLLQRSPVQPATAWVRTTTPADRATGVAASVSPTVVLTRDVRPASVTTQTVKLRDVTPGAVPGTVVAATPAWDATSRTLTVDPSGALVSGHTYEVRLSGLVDTDGLPLLRTTDQGRPVAWRFTVGTPPADSTPPDTVLHGAVGPDFGSGESVGVTATEPGTAVECRPSTTVPWTRCHDRSTYLASPTGQAEIWFRSVDGAGNPDPSPLHLVWDRGDPESPPNASVWDATVLEGASGTVSGRSAHAGSPARFDDDLWAPMSGSAVYYRWQAPASGTLDLTTAGSGFDTVLTVARPAGQTGYPQVLAGGDDVSADDRTSRVSLPVVAGRDYLVRVTGFARHTTDSGDVELGWQFSPGQNQAPTVSWTSPAAGEVLSSNVELRAGAADDGPDLTLTWWDGDTLLATDTTEPWSTWLSTDLLPDGPLTLTVRAEDAHGAVAEKNRSFTVDNGYPTASEPEVSLDRGGTLTTSGTVPVRVAWQAEDVVGTDFALVSRSVDGGAWSEPERVDADSLRDQVQPGHGYRWRVQVVDTAGHAGTPVVSEERRVSVVDDRASSVAWTRRWRTVTDPALHRDTGHRARHDRQAATWSLPAGVELGWVARTGSGYGAVDVLLDGAEVDRVPTASASARDRVLAWTGALAGDGPHVLRVRTRGTRTVLLDAFVLLR
jgi:subtilisin family serine protease